jgi:hypothetical protein
MVASGLIRNGEAGNTRSIGSRFLDKGKLRAFLKETVGGECGRIGQPEQ